MTFIPKVFTTRCENCTKQHIELGEFPPAVISWGQDVKKSSFSNTLLCNMFANLVSLIVTVWKILMGSLVPWALFPGFGGGAGNKTRDWGALGTRLIDGFFSPLHLDYGLLALEAEPAIQGTKIWRGSRLRNIRLAIVLFPHKTGKYLESTFILLISNIGCVFTDWSNKKY